MFKALGVLLLIYVAYAIFRGEVRARAGVGSTTVERGERPGYFWTVIVIYIGLAIAMMTVF